MIGRPGKWPWKKCSLIVTALIAVIDRSGTMPLDPVDEQHRIAMRQRRHDPPDVQRADGGAAVSLVQVLAALRSLLGCAGAVVASDGSAVLSAARRRSVTSIAAGGRQGRAQSRPCMLAPRRCITCW